VVDVVDEIGDPDDRKEATQCRFVILFSLQFLFKCFFFLLNFNELINFNDYFVFLIQLSLNEFISIAIEFINCLF